MNAERRDSGRFRFRLVMVSADGNRVVQTMQRADTATEAICRVRDSLGEGGWSAREVKPVWGW